jgi:hypothetical protein
MSTCRAPNVPDRVFRRLLFRPGFLSHSSLLAATMIQKSSLPENLRSVSMVLTPDSSRRRSDASPPSTKNDADAPSGLQLESPDHASSIVPTIVDGHYPRAALRALSLSSCARLGGLGRRLTPRITSMPFHIKVGDSRAERCAG